MVEMKLKYFSLALTSLLLIVGFTTISANKICSNNSHNFLFYNNGMTLYVGGNGPGNFSSIQDAINNASNGDTIFVYNGTYVDNVIINKSINLFGEDKNMTIINGNDSGSTIDLTSENVIIKNFTIIGGGFDDNKFVNFFRAGLRVTKSNNVICNNIFKDNRLGLSAVRVTNLTINDNIFINDSITLTPYENDKRWQIKLEYFLHNIENNIVNGKPLYYYKNQNNFEVPSDAGLLIAANCTNLTMKNATISNTDAGIILAFCYVCLIQNCTFSKNMGIWMLKSEKNTFQFNNISNNYHHGVILDYYSKNNKIRYNNISNNDFGGVVFEWYSNINLITGNNFFNNPYDGFELQSFFNKYYKNYYDDWFRVKIPILSFLPKLLLGRPIEASTIKFAIPLNIDLCPAKKPYDICSQLLITV